MLAEPGIELVGTRADGWTVICEPEAEDGRFACDLQQPDAPDEAAGSGGPGGGPGSDDGCKAWADGGSALVLWPPNHRLEVVTLENCAEVRSACGDGRATATTMRVPLRDQARGKIMIGDVALLFELVAPAPVHRKAQLPLSVLSARSGDVDCTTTVVAAFSFLLHFGAVGSLYAD